MEKRILSLVLCFAMILPMLCFGITNVSAADTATSTENLALSATASVSSLYGGAESWDRKVKFINDGDYPTTSTTNWYRWVPAQKSTDKEPWAMLTWSKAVTFDRVHIVEWAPDVTDENASDYRTTQWDLQTSMDGENWTTIHEEGDGTQLCLRNKTVTFDNFITAKYLKFRFLKSKHSSDWAAISEIEVFCDKTPPETMLTDADLSDNGTAAPASYGAVPNENQYNYAKTELCAFLHFSINTFTGAEWGSGKEDVSSFTLTTPIDFDDYVKTLKDAGFTRVVITAKHHDGFCMWPTAYSEQSIKNTGYGGDPLDELSEACTKYGMEMGIYLSPWDMNAPSYGYKDASGNLLPKTVDFKSSYTSRIEEYKDNYTEYLNQKDKDVLDYNDYYVNQLNELLDGRYGVGEKGSRVVSELWLDAAKGTSETAAPPQWYDFDRWVETVRALQPSCLISANPYMGDHTEVRLSGNERGFTAEDTWSKVTNFKQESGYWEFNNGYNKGLSDGKVWQVVESDVSITSGWFWGETKNIPKSADHLRQIYFETVARNSILQLNIPLDNQGKLTEVIKTSVENFGKNIRDSFTTNLLENSVASAKTVRGEDIAYSPNNTLDGDLETYYAAAEGEASATLQFDFNTPTVFDAVRMKEAIRFGERVKSYTVYYKNTSGNWIEYVSGTTVGMNKIASGKPVTATSIKIVFNGINQSATPLIAEVGAYKLTDDFAVGSTAPKGLVEIDSASANVDAGTSQTVVGGGYVEGTALCIKEGESVNVTFDGTYAYVYGGVNGNGGLSLAVDGGKEEIFWASGVSDSAVIARTGDLSDGTHTLTIKAVSGDIYFDALYALDNGGKGLVEFERSQFYMDEDRSYEIKLVRHGGSNGTLSMVVEDNPGSAVQYHYYPTNGIRVDFADGETEKTVTVRTKRYTGITSTLNFRLSITAALDETNLITGFNNPMDVDIRDAEEYTTDYLKRIEVTKYPAKTEYGYGEAPDTDGMEVKAVYENDPTDWTTIYTGTNIIDDEENIDGKITIRFPRPITATDLRLDNLSTDATIAEFEVYNSANPSVNLARSFAKTSQSSVATWAKSQGANKTIDGSLIQNNTFERNLFNYGDWNPWLRYKWAEPVTFDTIVIYEFMGDDGSGENGCSVYKSDRVKVKSFTIEAGNAEMEAERVLDASEYTVSPSFLTSKANTVTVTYMDKTASFDVSVVGAKHALVYDGFSVRVADYNGMRSVFYLDENVKNNGYTLKEYGTVAAATANKPSSGEFLTVDGDNITAANSKIIKTAVYKDGKIVNKTLDPDTDGAYAGMTKFGFTITNFSESRYENKVFVCGYEVWVNDATGLTEIIYTEYSNPDYTDISIYDLSLGMYKAGVLDSSKEDGVVWNVLLSGVPTFTKGTDYTVRDGQLDENGVQIGDTFTYKDVPLMYQTWNGTEKTLTFSAAHSKTGVVSDITVTLVRDGSGYTAFYRGTSEIPGGSYTKIFSLLNKNFAAESSIESLVGNACAPTLTASTVNKVKTIVLDTGITKINGYSFLEVGAETFVYPSTLTKIACAGMSSVSNLTTMYLAGTKSEVGLVDVSHVSKLEYAYTFNGCKKIVKLHLPINTDFGGAICQDCTALKGIWVGDGEYKEGVADLRNNIGIMTMQANDFKGVKNIKTFIIPDKAKIDSTSDPFSGLSGLTIVQSTYSESVDAYCQSKGYTYSYDVESDTFTGTYNDREYTVIKPANANGNWVWRTEFLGIYDYADRALKNLGWTIAYYKVSNMYGNDESVELLKQFHDYVTAEFGLNAKADVFGFSRGGLYAVNYALKYPSDVSTLYLDAPVLNLWSWPAGLGTGAGDASCWNEVKKMYGVDEETVKTHTGNPILHTDELISTEIPVILVAGDSDKTVPYSENGALLKKAYDDAGASANIKVIIKEGVDHHPHSLEDPTEIVNFIKANKSGFESGTDGNADAYSVANTFALPIRPLENKTIFWLGSSETRGAYSVNNEAVPEYFAKRQNATSIKSGVDGATVFFDDTITNDGNCTSTHSFVTRIKSFNKNAAPDALVVCVSTNDAKAMYYEGKDRLGSVTDADKTALADFDTSTTLGALEYIICYAKETWNCPVVLHTSTSAGGLNEWFFTAEQKANYENIVNALGALETKWGVTVLDLYGDTEMNSVSDTLFDNYMHDPVHPLRYGYLKWWTPKFEACLENILK